MAVSIFIIIFFFFSILFKGCLLCIRHAAALYGLARNIYVKNARSRDNANFIKYRKAHLDLPLDDLSNALCAFGKIADCPRAQQHFGSMKIAFTKLIQFIWCRIYRRILCY